MEAMKNNVVVAIEVAARMQRNGVSLWGSLAVALAQYVDTKDVDGAKACIKVGEDEYVQAHPKGAKPSELSAYRSAKSVALAAVKGCIALVDEAGKARGKTEVEGDIKAGKDEKTPIQKLSHTLKTMEALVQQCEGADYAEARKMIAETYARLFPLSGSAE